VNEHGERQKLGRRVVWLLRTHVTWKIQHRLHNISAPVSIPQPFFILLRNGFPGMDKYTTNMTTLGEWAMTSLDGGCHSVTVIQCLPYIKQWMTGSKYIYNPFRSFCLFLPVWAKLGVVDLVYQCYFCIRFFTCSSCWSFLSSFHVFLMISDLCLHLILSTFGC